MITIDRLSLPSDWNPKPGDLLRLKSISGSGKGGRWTFKMELVTDDSRIEEAFRKLENLAVNAPFHEGQPDTMYFQLSTDEFQDIKDIALGKHAAKD